MDQETVSQVNLIKTNTRRKPAKSLTDNQKVIKNQVISARAEAARIVADAEEFARKTRERVIAEAEVVRQNAYQEGMEKGLSEFEENIVAAREIREKVWRETEQDLLRLSVRLAEKVVGREIQKNDKAVISIVSTALQNARQQEKLTVRVHPSDLPLLESEIENLAPGGRTKFLDLVADPRVTVGGCLIESEVGTIDARLETQFRILERVLLAQSEGENSSS